MYSLMLLFFRIRLLGSCDWLLLPAMWGVLWWPRQRPRAWRLPQTLQRVRKGVCVCVLVSHTLCQHSVAATWINTHISVMWRSLKRAHWSGLPTTNCTMCLREGHCVRKWSRQRNVRERDGGRGQIGGKRERARERYSVFKHFLLDVLPWQCKKWSCQ